MSNDLLATLMLLVGLVLVLGFGFYYAEKERKESIRRRQSGTSGDQERR